MKALAVVLSIGSIVLAIAGTYLLFGFGWTLIVSAIVAFWLGYAAYSDATS